MAPTPTSDASTSTMNCRDGSGIFKMGAEMKLLSWTTVRSVLPHKGTDRQVSDNTCKDKTIYSQRVVDTETYKGDGE